MKVWRQVVDGCDSAMEVSGSMNEIEASAISKGFRPVETNVER